MSLHQSVRGTQDIFGTNAALFNTIVEEFRNAALSAGFVECILPIIEHSPLFERHIGEETDIISKEIYKFLDRNGEEISLRPEFTAGVARAYGQTIHALNSAPSTVAKRHKVFSSGAVFRYDRPQKGRYRQFHQINCELIRPKGPSRQGAPNAADVYVQNTMDEAEAISVAFISLKRLGLSQSITLELNSLGSKETIQRYTNALVEHLKAHAESLSKVSQHRLQTNPLRILDSKEAQDTQSIQSAPSILNYLTEQEAEGFQALQQALQQLDIPFSINHNLVRGLDYYTGTVFEFTTNSLGAQGTILAGGRYDSLIEGIHPKHPAYAIGFAAGIERLSLLMQHNQSLEAASAKQTANNAAIYILAMQPQHQSAAIKISHQIREKGLTKLPVIMLPIGQPASKAIAKILSMGPQGFLIVYGQQEHASQTIAIKNLGTSQVQQVPVLEVQSFNFHL